MSTEEVIEDIISEPKYYIGKFNQSTASRIVKRYKTGCITLNKLHEFITAFGYEYEHGKWVKTPN
jgi:hypothetical protein